MAMHIGPKFRITDSVGMVVGGFEAVPAQNAIFFSLSPDVPIEWLQVGETTPARARGGERYQITRVE